MPRTIEMFEDGFPPHQAALMCDGKAVLIMGLVEGEQEGVYWTWCIFGKDFKLFHYREFIIFFKDYLKRLEWKQILHIIDKQKPWTRHMAKSLGFSHSHDVNDQYEWWIING